jgi:hypothetical protein
MSRRLLVWLSLGLALVVSATVLTLSREAATSSEEAFPGRPFAVDSPFNVPVVDDPAIDPGSSAMVSRAAREKHLYANLVEFGVPVYTASARTPRHTVACRRSGHWGACPLEAAPMPIPDGASPSSGSDGAMVVVDPGNGTVGEYWQAVRTRDSWSASWGAVNALEGSGWGGSSTGSGASRLAGVVRLSEMQSRRIDHALVLQSDNVCRDVVRPPALKTDGDSARADCLPEGARLQLDPSLDIGAIPGITPGELAVARAMQVYGAYVIDRTGASLSMSFERAPDATSSYPGFVYADAGLTWDYYGMPHVPWDRLRVLQSWER